jgi:predicted glutamine amidotransferase
MEPGEFVHGDGHGISYFKDGKLKVSKSILPIWEGEIADDILLDIYNSPCVMIHSRKASPGLAINPKMVHPFLQESPVLGQAALIHNGTVIRYKELDYADHYTTDIESDSERLLFYFLTRMETAENLTDAIVTGVKELPQETSANFFLLQGNQFWASRNFYRFDNYLDLYTLVTDDAIVLSSEIIDDFGTEGWKLLNNREVFHIPDINNIAATEYFN